MSCCENKLPKPSKAPFDHVVVLMMENRSFDHLLGWLPGADGIQKGLFYEDNFGIVYPTYNLLPDYQGSGYLCPLPQAQDFCPNHLWEAALLQYNHGKMDGFLKSLPRAGPANTFPIGYYPESALSIFNSLAKNFTVCDRYFCSTLNQTLPNRFYSITGQSVQDNTLIPNSVITVPTIFDRFLEAGLTAKDYYRQVGFLSLWGNKYLNITKQFDQFIVDAALGNLPNYSIIDPGFELISNDNTDMHPPNDIRVGDNLIGTVYQAIRNSPNWDRTILIINFDEHGGFFDHVPPPKVIDNTDPATIDHTGNIISGSHPNYKQLGIRIPNILISPFSPATVDHTCPFEHCSILKMLEWRWGLTALTQRDKNAKNLALAFDFKLRRKDFPIIPLPVPFPVPNIPPFISAKPSKPVKKNKIELYPGAPPDSYAEFIRRLAKHLTEKNNFGVTSPF